MRAAAEGGFEVLITIDGGFRTQQNQAALPLAVILIEAVDNRFVTLRPYAPAVVRLMGQRLEMRVYVVERPDGP